MTAPPSSRTPRSQEGLPCGSERNSGPVCTHPTILYYSYLQLCSCSQSSVCLSRAPVLDFISAKGSAANHTENLGPSPHHSLPGQNNCLINALVALSANRRLHAECQLKETLGHRV